MPGSSASSKKGSPGSKFGQDAGVSPLFPPEYPSGEAAKEALLHVVRRDPRLLGHAPSRWSLERILASCPFLNTPSTSTLAHLLSRLGISWQRGRDAVHSPDPQYLQKLAYREALMQRVRDSARRGDLREVVLFFDEFTYYRQPTLAYDWAERGGPPSLGVLARRSLSSNTPTRVAATLDLLDARVCLWQGSRFGVSQLVGFYAQVRQAYPEAKRIWVVQDNWPVHFHPDVLCALEEQESPFELRLPKDWPSAPSPKALRRWGEKQLPIQVVTLPTYASWLNPIEKLWRWLKQEVLHLHRLATDLPALRQRVRTFLEGFARGSPALLRYVGLDPSPQSDRASVKPVIPTPTRATIAA